MQPRPNDTPVKIMQEVVPHLLFDFKAAYNKQACHRMNWSSQLIGCSVMLSLTELRYEPGCVCQLLQACADSLT